MEDAQHRFALNPHKGAVAHCNCRRHAKWLARKTTFSEKIARIQYTYRGLFASFRYYIEFDSPLLDVKHRIGGFTLSEDRVLLWQRPDRPTLAGIPEKTIRVELLILS